MKELLDTLYQYEVRHAPEKFQDTGNHRCRHWYKLILYSDGSGRVEDSYEQKVLFRFHNLDELESNLKL